MPGTAGGTVRQFLAALAAVACCLGAEPRALTLEGTVEPDLKRGLATVSAVQSPFYAETRVHGSRFSFRALAGGAYTLTVLDPQWGVTRQTVQVTPSFADERGRVQVHVSLDRSSVTRSRRAEGTSTVSLAKLRVSGKARAAQRKAHANFAKGNIARGTELLHRAVELAPTFSEAWNELGTVAYKAGEYARAEEFFREALEHEPLAFAPMANLGGALLSQERYREALDFNLMARSMQPEDALANSQLGMNFYHLHQLQKGREFLLRAKEADASHFSHPQLYLAQIYARLGELAKSVVELEEILRLHPDSPAARVAKSAIRRFQGADSAPGGSAAPLGPR